MGFEVEEELAEVGFSSLDAAVLGDEVLCPLGDESTVAFGDQTWDSFLVFTGGWTGDVAIGHVASVRHELVVLIHVHLMKDAHCFESA